MNAKSATTNDALLMAGTRRINQSLTASVEKRALQWMAERAPRWVSSDQLTLLGLCAQVGAGICYALSRYNRYVLLLVILCIALNWFGDSMDGTLARVRCQTRPRYGFYVDHMVDIFGSVALMCGLGCSPAIWRFFTAPIPRSSDTGCCSLIWAEPSQPCPCLRWRSFSPCATPRSCIARSHSHEHAHSLG